MHVFGMGELVSKAIEILLHIKQHHYVRDHFFKALTQLS